MRSFAVMKTITVFLGSALALVASAANAAEPVKAEEKKEETSDDGIDPKKQFLWLDAQGGIENVNLSTFAADFHQFSVGVVPRAATGPVGSFGGGLRLVFLTLGVRGRVATFDGGDQLNAVGSWTMSSIDGEIGIRAPLHRFEPYMTIAGGYTTLGGLNDAFQGVQSGLSVNGANGRVMLGFDYFVAKYISLGMAGSAEAMALTRPGIPLKEVAALPNSQTLDVAAVRALEANGTTWGSALALTGGVTGHF